MCNSITEIHRRIREALVPCVEQVQLSARSSTSPRTEAVRIGPSQDSIGVWISFFVYFVVVVLGDLLFNAMASWHHNVASGRNASPRAYLQERPLLSLTS